VQKIGMLFALIPWTHLWTDSEPLLHPTLPRLLLAMILGMSIGAERQWRQRAAGLRTNTLVCLAAAGFVDLGTTIAPGTTQVMVMWFREWVSLAVQQRCR
jgi:putative Mg2+ transporter-C (MgtC) family protein